MPTTTTFALQLAAQFAEKRSAAAAQLAVDQGSRLEKYQHEMSFLDGQEERYLSFVKPILASLETLADDVFIEDIKKGPDGEVAVVLSAQSGASMANLLLEYPALPFAVLDNGKMREPNPNKNDEAVYDGILINVHPRSGAAGVQWQSFVGGQVVNVFCKTQSLAVAPWKTPQELAQVATIQIGDLAITKPWGQVVQHGETYWAQPVSPVALAHLDKSIAWRHEHALQTQLRDEFNNAIANLTGLSSPRGKIVANALFSWATSQNELPSKEDFSAWAPPQGNVVAMHSPKDWDILADQLTSETVPLSNGAQVKISLLSRHLPNIWALVDNENGIATLCSAMAATRTRCLANQGQAVQELASAAR